LLAFTYAAYNSEPADIEAIKVFMKRFALLLVIVAAVACGPAQRHSPAPESLAVTERFAQSVAQYSPGADVRLNPGSPNFQLFAKIVDRVRDYYVDDVDDTRLVLAAAKGMRDAYPEPADASREQLVRAAIQGMLGSLDPYSSYLDSSHYSAVRDQTKGRFSGIGIQITKESDFIKVISPIDDTPAALAGIKAGDLITHADGESLEGLSLRDAVTRLRGPIGSQVVLSLSRAGASPFNVRIVRSVVRIKAVRWKLDGHIGYIRVTTFSSNTTPEFLQAVREIRAQASGGVAGFVLDLRNNPGGLLEQAITLSDAILNAGDIVVTRGRSHRQRYTAVNGDVTNGAPIVVLINEGSASASEILAGALRDHRRATLVGTRSFGKGLVQTILPLGEGNALKLTTSRYYTPSGQTVGKGIDPTIVVELDKDHPGDEQVDRAYAILRSVAQR
jgi:carboxyl-terminal processing protease